MRPDNTGTTGTLPSVPHRNWQKVLERAEADRLPFTQTRIVLFDDQRFHHSSAFCGVGTKEREYDAREAIDTTVPSWCECGGWEGTRFGWLLRGAAEQYEVLDAERDDLRHSRWDDVWHAFKLLQEGVSWGYRTDDAELKALRTETKRAALNILERSRDGLDRRELERRIAAQGTRVPVTPEQAVDLTNWAKGKLIDTRPDQGRRRDVIMEPFDRQLAENLSASRRRLVLVRGAPATSPLGFDFGLPAEIALYLWSLEQDTARTSLLHFQEAIALGVGELARKHPRISVGADDEQDPDVLAAVLTLVDDADGGSVDLDAILLTARLL